MRHFLPRGMGIGIARRAKNGCRSTSNGETVISILLKSLPDHILSLGGWNVPREVFKTHSLDECKVRAEGFTHRNVLPFGSHWAVKLEAMPLNYILGSPSMEQSAGKATAAQFFQKVSAPPSRLLRIVAHVTCLSELEGYIEI